MDTQIPSPQTFLAFLLFIFAISKIMKKQPKTSDGKPLKLPPGPWKLPLIGNLHNMLGPLPHHRLRDLANKYGPAMYLKLGEVPTLVISSPDTAMEMMKTNDVNFAQRPPLLAADIVLYKGAEIAFAPYGDYWRQIRKVCVLELLSARRVQSFWSIREQEVKKLMEHLRISSRTGSAVNLSQKLVDLSYNITGRAAFGGKCKDQEVLISVMKVLMEISSGFSLADVFPSFEFLHVISGERSRIEKLHHKVDLSLEKIINEHKARKATLGSGDGENEADCLLGVVLNLQQNGYLEIPFTEKNVKAVIVDMFAGGSETSATTTEWAFSELLKNPRIMKIAQEEVRKIFDQQGGVVDETFFDELKYLKLIIKETLRMHPPFALLLPRECRVHTKINGYDIPVKTKVITNAWAIGRDPNYWKEPDKFIPERFIDSAVDYKGLNFEFLPFGSGRRICPGMLFGI